MTQSQSHLLYRNLISHAHGHTRTFWFSEILDMPPHGHTPHGGPGNVKGCVFQCVHSLHIAVCCTQAYTLFHSPQYYRKSSVFTRPLLKSHKNKRISFTLCFCLSHSDRCWKWNTVSTCLLCIHRISVESHETFGAGDFVTVSIFSTENYICSACSITFKTACSKVTKCKVNKKTFFWGFCRLWFWAVALETKGSLQ